MAFTGTDLLMNADLFRLQFPGWPGLAPRNPAFADSDERADDEPAYIGGMSERQERLSSRDDN
jgi:hypothetical protein